MVSDLRPLIKLTKLERLWLYNTKVSKSQIAALKNALPRLIVTTW